MLCTLIYNRPEAEPNKTYIGFYRQVCARRGVDFHIVFKEDILNRKTPLPKHGFVINRTRDAGIALQLEKEGIPVYNNSRVTLLGNDKLAALLHVKSLGLPVLKTSVHIEDFDRFPIVMKSRDGHGGTEVFLLQDPEDARRYQNEVRRRRSALLDNTCRIPSARHSGLPAEGHAANGAEPSLPADTDTAWIYQEMADTPGKDLRVYVTGNRITAAMLRSSETDFRSNYCLGGQASVYKLSGTEKRIVDTILSSLDIGHCGIDFLFHKGHLIFNELEDVVGSRMLYRYTDIDVVSDYIDFILRDLHHM